MRTCGLNRNIPQQNRSRRSKQEQELTTEPAPDHYSCSCHALWYILAMEVARQFKESPPTQYNDAWLDKKFAITAAAVILVAAIFGGTIGSGGRNLGGFTSSNSKSSYHVADEIEKDYNEA